VEARKNRVLGAAARSGLVVVFVMAIVAISALASGTGQAALI